MADTNSYSNNKDNNKVIMQIHVDPTDTDNFAEDLKEYASTLSTALGYDSEEILEEMTEHDIAHLILTFNKYFSEYVELLDSNDLIFNQNRE